MTNEAFDRLWERAECERYAAEMTAKYPVWRRNSRRNLGLAVSLVAVTAVALPLLTNQRPAAFGDNYTSAFCNKPDIANQYWVDMADALLMEA